tara:strand:- start:479 stop:1465 length:987 start_codon:yes stop_codon:yes gene_type:complete
MLKKKISLAMIGCGTIANDHIRAFNYLGLKINHCASKLNSSKVYKFAKKYNISNVWKDPIELARSSKNWDAIILCCPTKNMSNILDILIDQKKPILVEKPVSIGTDYLKKFSSTCPKLVNVAFNRRYYNTVVRAKKFIEQSKGQILCNVKLPESIKKNNDKLNKFRNIFDNSVHGIDILRFLFGDLEIINNTKIKLNNFDSSRIVLLKSKKNHLCSVVINSNSPDNFSLEIENGSQRFLLKPFEKYEIYEGMEIIKPSKKYPLRRYIPTIIEKNDVFSSSSGNKDLKPGFQEQSEDFLRLILGKKVKGSPKLLDAFEAQKLLKKIMLS